MTDPSQDVPVIYTVGCKFTDPAVGDAWLEWLRRTHLRDVLDAGALRATVMRVDRQHYEILGFSKLRTDIITATAVPAVVAVSGTTGKVVFGEAGKHARLAVGVSSLPFNIGLEVEGVVEVRG